MSVMRLADGFSCRTPSPNSNCQPSSAGTKRTGNPVRSVKSIAIVLGEEPLVTANWVARAFDSQYTPIKLMRGVAYYIVKRGGSYAWERNPAYPEAPEPERVTASELDRWGVPTDGPSYRAFLSRPEAFAFLLRP